MTLAPKSLLVLGGTEFVGAAVVDDALSRGWSVTTLNRGTHATADSSQHIASHHIASHHISSHHIATRHLASQHMASGAPTPSPSAAPVRRLIGDRREPGGLDALDDTSWDIVVDTWSWESRAVRDAALRLADRADRYVYISSRSVHPNPTPLGADESFPIVDASADDEHYDDYPRAKAGGELGAIEGFGDRAILARPGLILGPRENIGRLPWWLGRAARDGDILAPGPASATVQYVDARDLATFVLDAAAAGLSGPFSVVSEPDATTMGELLEACLAVTGSDGTLRWTDPGRLLDAGVRPWMDLPIWIPQGEDHDTMFGADVSRARDAGLRIRPITETVADTWAWLRSIGGVAPQRPDRPALGLDPSVEATLLD